MQQYTYTVTLVELCIFPADVCRWRWNCGDIFHNGEYMAADFEGFTFAMSMAVQFAKKAGTKWVASLVTALGKQYNR